MKSIKSMRKPPPLAGAAHFKKDADSDVQFELELYWCIQQLETALNGGKLSQKIAVDTSKNIKILKSSTAPLIRKRQVMKAALGDYRAKMKEEEKRMTIASKQIKFTEDANQISNNIKKSSFVKKSAILTSGKDFRFDFNARTELDDCAKDNEQHLRNNAELEVNSLHFTNGTQFKFNFIIDEMNDNIMVGWK
uniref:Hypothetical conserved protein n=1 Tax=Glossina morsitans morsitans TaxID=37546 RepID=D3TPU4_GLOMM